MEGIDEGFGTLDENHTSEIQNILMYCKKRYKNTLIITHKNDVKDFVQNIIQVQKITQGLTDEQLIDKNAGITIFTLPNV